jgi:multicomponent Na+:H+ antiporter subunit G
MTLALDLGSLVLLAIGLVFVAGGTLGLVRLPDLYSRAHAAGKCDSVGASAILLALVLQAGFSFGDLKLLLLVALVLVTAPTAAHALARSAYRTGLEPWRRAPAAGWRRAATRRDPEAP